MKFRIDKPLQKIEDRLKEASHKDVYEQVFDRKTLLFIKKLINQGFIDTVDFPISTGKEGVVFRVTTPKGKFAALKIYRITNATFNTIHKYIEGDRRFEGLKGNRQKIIYQWTIKEFKNLRLLFDAKVHVPEPIKFLKNTLIMQYIGDEDAPAPLLYQIDLENPAEILDIIIEDMRKSYHTAHLIHGDLSEYNIMVKNGIPYMIDVSQGLLTNHYNADEFLTRDCYNIAKYFSKKYRLDITPEKIKNAVLRNEE